MANATPENPAPPLSAARARNTNQQEIQRRRDAKIEEQNARLEAARMETERIGREIAALLTRGEPRDVTSLQDKTEELAVLARQFKARADEARRWQRRARLRMAGVAILGGIVAFWWYRA
ncbi:hypothetical protein B0T14DRAFT_526451 [Immersiella caudata]|uniref:Uncharacterized protein n=1 Tax=Immersiella caudata TaxID=314043 RepID=A0AA40BTY8_9PEZI|nr:hypothetical protein B0T14DRAFT_526451 [Immersiella caudata]